MKNRSQIMNSSTNGVPRGQVLAELGRLIRDRGGFLKSFRRDEGGTILIFTIILLIIMLVIGGMAVDFMRFESRRAVLQSVADRAVLAGADLDQTIDPAAVVENYFEITGFSEALVGTPDISQQGGTRSVGVTAALDIDTYYLRFIGIDELTAPAASQAIEGTGNIEISLVLDISGSMKWDAGTTGKTRIELLRPAAKGFVDLLLLPDYEDQISISLVNYSQNVNLGPDVFNALGFTQETIVDPDDGTTFTNPSYCVDLPEAAFDTVTFSSAGFSQVETFQARIYGNDTPEQSTDVATLDQPNCPIYSEEAILPLSQNVALLNARIDALQPRQYTSIYHGVKWATTMLDPSVRDELATIPSIDAAFSGSRPAEFGTETEPLGTKKFIVLMTDGRNQSGQRVAPTAYDEVYERIRWSNYNAPYWSSYQPDDENGESADNYDVASTTIDNPIDETKGDELMDNICSAAKDKGIVIFAIGLGVTNPSMISCASSPSFYFETDGGELDSIFDQIAVQITNLRLTL